MESAINSARRSRRPFVERLTVFNYPIVAPRGTLYATLGLGPEATMAQIGEAKASAARALGEERRLLEQRLAPAFEAVPRLREARETASQQGRSAWDANTRAGNKLADLERRAVAALPEYPALCRRLDELAERATELNLLPLQPPEKRASYDREHPPLAILKLAPELADSFGDNRVALRLLRRDLSAFLAEAGVPVFHPSDLSRTDFSADFTWTPGLDGEGA